MNKVLIPCVERFPAKLQVTETYTIAFSLNELQDKVPSRRPWKAFPPSPDI